ncbi:copper amine oxidase N-terminal domain-containing protein [Paenibacillus flagellatus]|uniref:copper amine oxidase N-terminal domain-containing protein n=1 Tax=Paenibacillus flagellatus TaxID=2211139 RepID=UPI001305352B|nr:copper amine oxidase N-terminal domain-containing protein [Paenibacillus flagellatus]
MNRALVAGMDTNSMQQSVTVSLHMKADPFKLSEEAKAMIELWNDAKLDIRSMKMESWDRMSLQGQLTLAKGVIPFQAYMSGEERLVLKVEGLSRAIVIPLTEPDGSTTAFTALTDKLQKEYQAKGIDKSMASLIVSNLPNPKTIKVTSGSETIHNENVNVYKLETSLDGTELVPLAKTFIRNLTKDDDNFKRFIGELYDVLWPVLKPYLEKDAMPSAMLPESPLGASLGDKLGGLKESLMEAASDKELAVDIIHNTAKQILYFALIGIDSASRSEEPAIQTMLSKQTQVKARLAFDQSLNLRKSDLELTIPAPDGGKEGITAIQFNVQSETWDRNKPVKADVLDAGQTPFVMGQGRSPFELLEEVDPESLLGQLIAFEKKQNEPKVVNIPLHSLEQYAPDGAYMRDGVSYIPLDELASYLDADVVYKDDSITITGIWDTIIELASGSSEAIVDGEAYEMDGVVIKQGERYDVPLRFVAEQLYCEVFYDADQEMIELVLPED